MNCRTLLKKYTQLAGAALYPQEGEWLVYFEKQGDFCLPRFARAKFEFPCMIYYCNKLYTKDGLPPTVWSDIIHEITHHEEDEHNATFWAEYKQNKGKTKDLEKKFRQELRGLK